MKEDTRLKSGTRGLCFVFSISPSKTRIMAGRNVTQQMTPIRTPFDMTMPISRPSAKVMTHRARKPATVVMELEITEVNVLEMATPMASFLSSGYSLLHSSKVSSRKIE